MVGSGTGSGSREDKPYRSHSADTGRRGKLEVGEHAIAIGNPLGLDFQRSVTSGIISALNRTIRIETANGANFMEDLIQTDASITPATAEGPCSMQGEVVSINTVKVTSAEGWVRNTHQHHEARG